MGTAKCYRLGSSGLSLFVRVTPNAGRDVIEGVEARDDDTAVLRIRVKAPPDRGRANAAVAALVAGHLRIPKSAVTVASGETARMKTLSVMGDAPVLARALDALVGP